MLALAAMEKERVGATLDNLLVRDGTCEFRPWGECTLVEAVDLISSRAQLPIVAIAG
jgi:hypothetical protein